VKTPCIILWNRLFERYDLYTADGVTYCHSEGFDTLSMHIKNNSHCLREVPINSRIGRQILAKIGERKV
jgi:hypothetical protein